MSRPPRRFVVDIDLGRCRSCAVCWDPTVCEPQVLDFEAPFNKAIVVDIDACTGCRHCEWLCPDWAIVVREADAEARVPTVVDASIDGASG